MPKTNLKMIYVFCSILLVSVIVYSFYSAGEVPKNNPLVQHSIQVIKPTHSELLSQNESQKDESITELAEEVSDNEDTELTPEEKLNSLLSALTDKIQTDGEEFNNYIHTASDGNIQERFELVQALLENPELVDSVLNDFLSDPSSHVGVELSAVLSEVGTPEIQNAALNLGLDPHSGDAESRAMALLLVSDIDEITPAARDRLLDSYAVETDTELLQFSLMALKPAVSSQEDLTRVHTTLTETMSHDNADVRRHAAYQQAEWATSNEDLSLLRSMALEESDDNARYRAIGSIAESDFKSAENRNVLTSVVNNESEWSIVREQALTSLKKYPLSDNEVAELSALSERIEAQKKSELQ